jgi:hypothetical protein
MPILSTVAQVSIALASGAILAVVLYLLGFPQLYLAYWRDASVEAATGRVSAKRAVFIHVSAAAGFIVGYAILKKEGFTKETLAAFEAWVYSTAGAYTLGKGLEVAARRIPVGDTTSSSSTTTSSSSSTTTDPVKE